MAEDCKFPICSFTAEKNGYCARHKFMAEGSPAVATTKPTTAAAKPQKPIAKKSAKMKSDDKILAELKKLETNRTCELKSPVCNGKFECWDHQQKSTPKNRTVRSNLKRSCGPCNGYKEQNPEWAIANGHHVSKFKK